MRAIAFALIFVAQVIGDGLTPFRKEEGTHPSWVGVADAALGLSALVGTIVCIIGGW